MEAPSWRGNDGFLCVLSWAQPAGQAAAALGLGEQWVSLGWGHEQGTRLWGCELHPDTTPGSSCKPLMLHLLSLSA